MPELTADKKASHRTVHYEYPSEHAGEACGDCKHVIEKLSASAAGPRCETVASPIFFTGWCVRFEAKRKKGKE